MLFALAVFSLAPVMVACPKKETPEPPEAAPPPPVETATPTDLVPLEEPDAMVEDVVEAGKKLGPGVPTNVARLKQCCNQLTIQAKGMANTPEGGMFQQAATQCNTMAASLGPNAQAPEMGAIKAVLAGRNIPAVCAGF
jgi:hypothetical protein